MKFTYTTFNTKYKCEAFLIQLTNLSKNLNQPRVVWGSNLQIFSPPLLSIYKKQSLFLCSFLPFQSKLEIKKIFFNLYSFSLITIKYVTNLCTSLHLHNHPNLSHHHLICKSLVTDLFQYFPQYNPGPIH